MLSLIYQSFHCYFSYNWAFCTVVSKLLFSDNVMILAVGFLYTHSIFLYLLIAGYLIVFSYKGRLACLKINLEFILLGSKIHFLHLLSWLAFFAIVLRNSFHYLTDHLILIRCLKLCKCYNKLLLQDEDDEEGEPKGKKAKMSNNAKGKAPSPKKNAKK